MWITPRLAVAVNLAQLVALANQSKLSLKNWSLVVPQCIKELHITVAVWQIEFLTTSLLSKLNNKYVNKKRKIVIKIIL